MDHFKVSLRTEPIRSDCWNEQYDFEYFESFRFYSIETFSTQLYFHIIMKKKICFNEFLYHIDDTKISSQKMKSKR